MRAITPEVTIVIVTHNLQQAGRVSDFTAFITVDLEESDGDPAGRLVEFGPTKKLFSQPADERS